MERDIEKDLLEIEYAIKCHIERDNMFTVSVLQRCHKLVSQLKEYKDFEEIFRSKMTDAACEFLKNKEEFTRWLDRNKWIAKKCDEYAGAEEQGKLLKLPCVVGDTVYEVQELRERIQPYTIIAVHISNCGNLYSWELKDGKGVYSNLNGFSEYAIGKIVFLTWEEAETALNELKKGGENG